MKHLIIVSQQRSGTHFLNQLIRNDKYHEFGEAFGAERRSSQFMPYFKANLHTIDSISWSGLYKQLWNGYVEKGLMKVGKDRYSLILMYNQFGYLPELFLEFLLSRHMIVHLVRKNVVRRHVSNHINRLKLRPAHHYDQSTLVTIDLPVAGLVEELDSVMANREGFRQRLSNTSCLEIAYEDLLLEGEDNAINDVAKFAFRKRI